MATSHTFGLFTGNVGTYMECVGSYSNSGLPDLLSVSSSNVPAGMSVDVWNDGSTTYVKVYGTPTQAGTWNTQINNPVFVDVWNARVPQIRQEHYCYFNITIYQPQYTHTIYYNANGGSGSMSETTVTDTNSGSTNVTFSSNGFSAPANKHFGGWSVNGTTYQPGWTIGINGNSSVTAYAIWDWDTYTITATGDIGGTASGGGTYNYGSTVTLTATPNQGCVFMQWNDGDKNQSRTITVTQNKTYIAYFATAPTLTGSGTQADPYTYISCTAWYATLWTNQTKYVQSGTTVQILDADACEPWDLFIDSVTAGHGLSVVNYGIEGTASTAGTVTVLGSYEGAEDYTFYLTILQSVAQINVKVDGSWTEGSVYVKVNGSWVEAKKIYTKVNGTWEESV